MVNDPVKISDMSDEDLENEITVTEEYLEELREEKNSRIEKYFNPGIKLRD